MGDFFFRPVSTRVAAALIALAALLVYSNSLGGAFVYDDDTAVLRNASIARFDTALFPPGDSTVGCRPVLNLTFAINHAISGTGVWSYHLLNLLIHILAGVTLFGLVQSTLRGPILQERFGGAAPSLALIIAFLWTVHPVQTDSVTYISERAESLMGLFYFLTLYGLVRASGSPSRRWPVLSVTACLLGMATKEVMVTAPLMALLYDRTFLSGSFQKAWQQRRKLYLALAATWLLLGFLLLGFNKSDVGFGGLSPLAYGWIEADALLHYLRLAVWPHPLSIDYGAARELTTWEGWPQVLLVLALVGATLATFPRRPLIAFAGVWFFLLLAPTSSFLPLNGQPVGENRLYLPLAGLIAFALCGLYGLMGRRVAWIAVPLALVWGALTFHRNEDYRSVTALWRATIVACPENERAHNNYGLQLRDQGDYDGALAQLAESIRLYPDYVEPYRNTGEIYYRLGRYQEALPYFQEAARINSASPGVETNWGVTLAEMGRTDEAITHFQEAIRLHADDAMAANDWGTVLLRQGHFNEAIPHFEQALELDPKLARAHSNWGIALFELGRRAEAFEHFQTALQLEPGNTTARSYLEGN